MSFMKKTKNESKWTLKNKISIGLICLILLLLIVYFLLLPLWNYIFIGIVVFMVQIISGLTGQPGFS